MPRQRVTTWLDRVLYAWASVFILAASFAFPPMALLWLLFPLWHRRRTTRTWVTRVARQDALAVDAWEAHRQDIVRRFAA